MLITYTDNAITDNTMTIDILYFASLTDEANCSEERVTVQQATSLTHLYEQLNQKYHFSRSPSQLRVAINDDYVNWNELIYDGDHVEFISPLTGG